MDIFILMNKITIIKSKICKLGYIINYIESKNTLSNSSTLGCFKNTIMVFRKVYK